MCAIMLLLFHIIQSICIFLKVERRASLRRVHSTFIPMHYITKLVVIEPPPFASVELLRTRWLPSQTWSGIRNPENKSGHRISHHADSFYTQLVVQRSRYIRRYQHCFPEQYGQCVQLPEVRATGVLLQRAVLKFSLMFKHNMLLITQTG